MRYCFPDGTGQTIRQTDGRMRKTRSAYYDDGLRTEQPKQPSLMMLNRVTFSFHRYTVV